MSSCIVIQEYDRITFAVDTARSIGDNNMKRYRVYEEKVQKVHKVGLDMVFIAGMDECVKRLNDVLVSFVNNENHIDIELLKQHLKKEFPKEKSKYADTGLNDIGVMVLSINSNESIVYSFSQKNEYETIINKPSRDNIKLLVDGFEIDKIFDNAMEHLRTLRNNSHRDPEAFITIYQNNYSESVGGYIQVYSMDSTGCRILREHKLDEKNLCYAFKESDFVDTEDKHLKQLYSSHVSANVIRGGTISGTEIDGVTITGGTIIGTVIEGSTFNRTENSLVWTTIDENGFYQNLSGDLKFQAGNYGGYGYILSDVDGVTLGSPNYHSVAINRYGVFIDGQTPVTSGNIGSQSVSNASNASFLNNQVYVSTYGNLRPVSDAGGACGSSEGRWSSVWAVNGTIQTSDRNKKNTIADLDERYLRFAKMIVPKTFKMNEGTSGRTHVGFIAQDIEDAMTVCGITDTEFAGLIKAPVYSKKLVDEDENELNEYDITSEIIGYDYALRYDEFIPLLFAGMKLQEDRLSNIEKLLEI